MSRVTLQDDVTLVNQTTLALDAPNLALHVTTGYLVITTHQTHEDPEWVVTTVLRRHRCSKAVDISDESSWDLQNEENTTGYFDLLRRVLPGGHRVRTTAARAARVAPFPSLDQIQTCANTFWFNTHSLRSIIAGGTTAIWFHENKKHPCLLLDTTRLVMQLSDAAQLFCTHARFPMLTLRLEGSSSGWICDCHLGHRTMIELAHTATLLIDGYILPDETKGTIVVSNETNSTMTWGDRCPTYHTSVYRSAPTGTRAYRDHMKSIKRHITWSKGVTPSHQRAAPRRGGTLKGKRNQPTKRSRDDADTPSMYNTQPSRKRYRQGT